MHENKNTLQTCDSLFKCLSSQFFNWLQQRSGSYHHTSIDLTTISAHQSNYLLQ